MGSLVVPVGSPGGEIVGLCARRTTDNDDSAILFASGMAGGIFNEGAVRDEVVLTESVFDALAAISAGCEATLAPGRPGGFTRADLERLASSGVRRAVLVGDALRGLKERLSAVGIEAVQVACGRCLHGLLASSPDPSQAIACLLGSAASMAHDRVDKAETPVVKEKKVSGDASELHLNFGIRRWHVRGAERNKVPDSVHVSLMVSDTETGEFHLDALDLCVAKARAGFVQAAGAELPQTRRCSGASSPRCSSPQSLPSPRSTPPGPPRRCPRRNARMLFELLSDPGSQDRVIADLNLLGVVGEETNLLVAYLATISRISEHPFGVVVQSSSAAGKSPPSPTPCASSCRKRTSRATRHSRARPSTTSARATSPTRCWRSRNNKAPPAPGPRSSCWSQRDGSRSPPRARTPPRGGSHPLLRGPRAGRPRAHHDRHRSRPRLSNRLVVLGVDEDQAQTRAIHAAQRRAASLEGLVSRWRKEALVLRHRNAQRLLEALPVVISGAEELSFPNYATRHRRDHQKLLSLIGASALLHQHQRSRGSIEVNGRAVDYLQADERRRAGTAPRQGRVASRRRARPPDEAPLGRM